MQQKVKKKWMLMLPETSKNGWLDSSDKSIMANLLCPSAMLFSAQIPSADSKLLTVSHELKIGDLDPKQTIMMAQTTEQSE